MNVLERTGHHGHDDASLLLLNDPALDAVFSSAERIGVPSAWWRHVPFAHWAVAAAAPRLLVELGTHHGVSYSAFCAAVRAARLPTQCFAVDSWTGDPHAGLYGEEVFQDLVHHQERFADFSRLLRCSFDDALPRFEDGSIDLLHIDGLHTHDAVRHDFEAWLPKLSERAVVLFHDTNVRERDFGVWRLWSALRDRYPSFEFLHGEGLGVLAVGQAPPAAIRTLTGLADPQDIARLRSRFAWLGERWLSETRERMLATDLGAALQEARREAADLSRQGDMLRQAAAAGAASAATLLARAESQRQAARTEAETRRAEADRAAAAWKRLSAEVAHLEAGKRQAEQEAATLRETLQVVTTSTMWRVLHPLRRAAGLIPRPARNAARMGLNRASRLLMRRPDHRPGAPPAAAITPPAAASSHAPPSSAALRLLYISGEAATPGHHYRVERPAAAARAIGAKATILPLAEIGGRLAEVARADIVILWRTAWCEEIAAVVDMARTAGARIVFDVDDLMVDPSLATLEIIDGIRSYGLTEAGTAAHFGRVRQCMLAADFCTTSTEELAAHLRKWGKPTRVLPNGFDHATLIASRLAVRHWARTKDGLLRIGYAGGSRTHQRDFALCADAVAAVLRAHPQARLVAFRAADGSAPILDVQEFPALRGLENQVEWRSFVPLHRLPEEVARFDINLAPLEVGNAFCEAKSDLKFFEAALVDVPTIASPTGPYRAAIEDGRTGFLAATPAAWEAALMRLAGDAALRARIAGEARRKVLWTYGPERRQRDMMELLDLIRGGRASARAFETELLRAAAPARSQARPPRIPAHEVVFDSDALGGAQVTIGIPLYNYAGFVPEALDSVAAQTLSPIDLIIVDDASTDDSLAVALRWAKANAARFNRLLVVRNLANAGLGPTRNVFFDLADTPWVLPLDADNHLLPDCAAACLAVAEKNAAAMAYPLIQKFGEATGLLGNAPFDPARLALGNYVDAMALIARGAWAGVGGYDHVPGGLEDYDLWCRFIEQGLFGVQVPGEPLAEYRVHAGSMLQTALAHGAPALAMRDDLARRHPWLQQIRPPEEEALRALPAPAATAAGIGRLATLLPLLRCPAGGGCLSLAPDGAALVAEDGRRWPLLAGRPNLFPGLSAPQLNDDSHVSNPLPEAALALMRAAHGPVLHLSAGGSAERLPHVVEAEAAVFRHTDVLADAHDLPFVDGAFEAVVAMNAFEHYRDPKAAAAEILRVLRPGGRVLIRTAFLQPQHEAPWHFFNCTRYGLAEWFADFDIETLRVSENFHPGHALAWLASECEAALRAHHSARAADAFGDTTLADLAGLWRAPEDQRAARGIAAWADLAALPQPAQEGIAAGFELLARKPG
ncbi:MAG TPA: class I SAM-dependent methyltransferase [Roseomonas sp.]